MRITKLNHLDNTKRGQHRNYAHFCVFVFVFFYKRFEINHSTLMNSAQTDNNSTLIILVNTTLSKKYRTSDFNVKTISQLLLIFYANYKLNKLL